MKSRLSILFPALLLGVGIYIAYGYIKEGRKLPIYAPAQLNPELVDIEKQSVTKNHRISDFELFDQDGKPFSSKGLDGKFYVTDFFFTTCPTICPDMSSQLERVQENYKERKDFLILSHTVQPEVDSFPVLREYAKRYHADPERWVFLTGDKSMIYKLARKSYFAAVSDGDGGIGDFIHTENFVLVDKEKRIRGFYDGTSEESVDQLIEDISILIQEYEK